MRILHVSDSYLPTLGGIELHLRNLTDRQRAQGDDVVLLTRTPAGSPPDLPGVLRDQAPTRAWLTSQAPDVVHAHVSIVSPFALATARRAASLGLPTVITVHSMWTGLGGAAEVVRDLWGMRSWPVRWSAVSRQAAQPISDLLGVPVTVLPNAVDLDLWTPGPARPVGPTGGPTRVISVMRLTRVKRAVPLVKMLHRVSRVADIEALIVGDGPERDTMSRYLRRHDLGERVVLAGSLGQQEVQRRLRRASVFVAPAHRESFGIAALEARASGVPVLASSRSGVGSFVEHERTGLLGARDEDLTRHLIALATHSDLLARLARHSRTDPPDHGWPRALARHGDLYELARSTARRPSARRAGGARAVRAA